MFDNSRFALVITQAYAFVTRINITSTKAEGEAVRLSGSANLRSPSPDVDCRPAMKRVSNGDSDSHAKLKPEYLTRG